METGNSAFRNCRFVFAVFVVSLCLAAGAAHAQEKPTIRIWGDYDFSFNYVENVPLTNGRHDDSFYATQRLRVFITTQITEHLSTFTMIRILPDRWGHSAPNGVGAGYRLDADGVNLRTRHMYLRWQPVKSFAVTMGMIPTDLPFASYRNGVLDTVSGGVMLDYKFTDNVSTKFFWARPYASDDNMPNERGASTGDKMDMFFLSLPMKFSWPNSTRWNITPWGLYSVIGKNSAYWNDRIPAVTNTTRTTVDDDGTGWWTGFASTYAYENFSLKGDFAYGAVRSAKHGFNYNANGWFAALKADYTLDWGTPGLFGWYATGSDADKVERDNTWGHMPTISTFGDGFGATSLGFKGHFGTNASGVISWIPAAKWGIGAQITDISFVDRLKHTIRVAYYQGTNDTDLAGNKRALANTRRDYTVMTKDDYAVELNFNHEVSIYQNLTMGIDMGYINMHRSDKWGDDQNLDDVYAVAVGFKFKF